VLLAARKQLDELTAHDFRNTARHSSDVMQGFWDSWREQYGDTGLKNPRGDRLLTELAVKAMRQLKPRLMMINYQDPDYVHWGNASHYTRAIAIIDQGLKRLVAAADSDPAYRDQTVFVVVPDCGRDANPLMSVPYQHHFNSRSAHEIFALLLGPGIAKGKVLDKPADQTSIAATVGAIMGIRMRAAEGRVLSEILT
jgi:bisphosphoglycerate-independent phosphoglycerate mutase (AlkP superfamily)